MSGDHARDIIDCITQCCQERGTPMWGGDIYAGVDLPTLLTGPSRWVSHIQTEGNLQAHHAKEIMRYVAVVLHHLTSDPSCFYLVGPWVSRAKPCKYSHLKTLMFVSFDRSLVACWYA